MYIYLEALKYEGEYILDACTDEEAINEWSNHGQYIPESSRLRRVHNTGTQIIREEYVDGTWVEIDNLGRRVK